jgi:hypothetical protein
VKKTDNHSLSLKLGMALCFAIFASMPVFAQSEKISIRMIPEPNQTIRTRMIHEMDIDVIFEGEMPQAAAFPQQMKLASRIVFALTRKIGAPDKDGAVTSELIYDEASSEMTMNGQPLPIGDAFSRFIGQKVMMTFNMQGDIIDIKAPSALGMSEDSFKQMLTALSGNLPRTAIGVGEIVTTPLDFTVPLPVPGAPPVKMNCQINSKLVSIEKVATGRIAKFNQTADGKIVMEIPRPDGQAKMSMDFKVNGGGESLVDVDKGVLKSSDSKMTISGKLRMSDASSEKKFPTMNFQGTMKTTVTGSN